MVEQVFLLLLTSLASYWDWRSGRIPNAILLLSVPAIATKVYRGEVGESLGIIAFIVMLHLFAYLRGWVGGGDVKFALSLALSLGRLCPAAWLYTAIYAGIFGGFLLFRGHLLQGLLNFAVFVNSGKAGSGKSFPYGVALSLGTWTAMLLK